MSELSEKLIGWYDRHRRVLPWREDPTPYHVWVSEIMLQQTRVEAVKGYYTRFLEAFPDVHALAEASEGGLLKLWQGLGYYSRARNLQKAAKQLVQERKGKIPATLEELRRLPGIGAYTAGAIASIAFGQPVIAPDGNAYRIFSRLEREQGFLEDRKTKERLEERMRLEMDTRRPGAFNQALMDLGSLICVANGQPLCPTCPLRAFCAVSNREDASQFPRRRPKKPRQMENKTVVVMQRGDRLLLHQRPSKGLLAGLWLFPMFDGHLTQKEVLLQLLEEGICRKDIQKIETLEPATHIFSHLEWHMIGYRVTLSPLSDVPCDRNRAFSDQENFSHRADAVHEADEESFETLQLENKTFWADPDEIANRFAIPAAHRPFFVER